MNTRAILIILLVTGGALASSTALACGIENTTEVSFTVRSGDTGNQRVGAHTTTTIADGNIELVGDNGAGGGGGTCSFGQNVKIVRSGSGFAVVPAR